jgi:hypothetical protein
MNAEGPTAIDVAGDASCQRGKTIRTLTRLVEQTAELAVCFLRAQGGLEPAWNGIPFAG